MTDHEHVRPLLALSAAGLLDPEGERRVREHVAECVECREEMESFALIAAGLMSMPAPPPPADLLVRTRAIVAAEADRRQGARLAVAAAVVATVLTVCCAAVLRSLFGEGPVLTWYFWSLIPSVLGAAAAIVLASHRRIERSFR